MLVQKKQSLVDPKNIALLCWGLVGDTFIRIPSIEAIRNRFPNARILVIVNDGGYRVLADHPAIDQLLVLNRTKKPTIRYLVKTVTVVRLLRKLKLDVMIDFYGGGSSSWIMLLSNAKERIGFNTGWKQKFASTVRVPEPSFCGSWHKSFGHLLGPLGIEQDKVRRGTSFFYPVSAKEFAEKLFKNNQGPFVAINLGAGGEEKCWPVESFVLLAKKLFEDFQIKPVVFTNPGQEYLTEKFTELYGSGKELTILPLTPMDREGAVMDHCQFVISSDTALLHLAMGLKKPSVGLFTFHRPEIVTPEDCLFVPVFKEDPRHHDSCGNPRGRQDISVEEVYESFCKLRLLVESSGLD